MSIKFGNITSSIRSMAPRHILIDASGQSVMDCAKLTIFLLQSLELGKDFYSIGSLEHCGKWGRHSYIILSKDTETKQWIAQEQMMPIGIILRACHVIEAGQKDSKFMEKVLVKYEDIIQISSSNKKNNIKIITKDRSFDLRKTFKEISEGLPHNFIRVERRDIINMNYLVGTGIAFNSAFLEYKEITLHVPIGKKYKEAFIEKFNNGLFIEL